MLASLYSLLFKTEDYDSTKGTLIGLLILLVGLLATFTLYSIALVDETTDNNPSKKQDQLRTIIVAGFTLSTLISVFVGFSINRYNFCKAIPDICVLDLLDDKKDKLRSKLFMKKLELAFSDPKNILQRCVSCSTLYTKK
jgi:hypothetical protein